MILKYIILVSALYVCESEAGAVEERSSCKEIMSPPWGVVNCSNGQEYGSVCKLSCEKNYDLDFTTDTSIVTTCIEETGEWSASPWFSCSPVRCFPKQEKPLNGDLVCSATNLARSLCAFYCDNDYDMVGVDTDKNSYLECVDDGDGDAIGKWAAAQDKPVPPTTTQMCQPRVCNNTIEYLPNGKVICSAGNVAGSFCVFICDEGYDLKGTTEPVLFSSCKSDKERYDGYGEWTLKKTPVCRKCKRVKSLQLIALIHGVEGDSGSYALANRIVLRTATALERKYRFKSSVRVNRYSDKVDTSNEFFTSEFTIKRDKNLMTSMPYPGSGESLEKALYHVKTKLDDEASVRVAMIIANGFTLDAKSQQMAEDLIKDGVLIYVYRISKNGDDSGYSKADMVKIAGSEKRVFDVKSRTNVEMLKAKVADEIAQVATELGCKN
ncbi:uncharacterized protein LOC120330668 isoform X1 [Styela clava]